jgi:hypothetical protein
VGDSPADNAINRLLKYIPAEIISGYMVFAGIVDAASKESALRRPAAWGIFFLGLALTPIYLWKVGRPTGVRWWQLPISTVSFALWAYALGGPFKLGEPFMQQYAYEGWFAALAAGAFSWGVALVWKPEDSPK